MNKKFTVTIGIPAYNEEANIGYLLKSLLSQEKDNFKLEKIIVISDGSTDKTASIVKSIKSPFIKLISLKERQGLNKTQNKILEKTDSDLLIIINADVLPVDNNLIETLVENFSKDKKVGIVSCQMECISGDTFISKVLSVSNKIKESTYQKFNDGDNVYLCHGQVRAFSKDFYKNFKWDLNSPEDAYSYFACKEEGFRFIYESNAKVFYAPSRNIKDHIKQSNRFLFGKKKLEFLFNKDLVNSSYRIPRFLLLKSFGLGLLKYPILLTSYGFLMIYIRIFKKQEPIHHSKYAISTSSKKLLASLLFTV